MERSQFRHKIKGSVLRIGPETTLMGTTSVNRRMWVARVSYRCARGGGTEPSATLVGTILVWKPVLAARLTDLSAQAGVGRP
jgi:hypothetical protein